jgi:hypothetical protein
MRIRLTIFLLLANLAVFYWIYQLERDPAPNDAPVTPSALVIDRIEISGPALAQPRVLELRGGNWQITSPIDWPANYFAVQRILTELQFIEPEVAFTLESIEKSGQTLADYGLEKPNLSIRYGSGDTMVGLLVGEPTRAGNRIYVLNKADNRVLVLNREFLQGLMVDMQDLRSQQVFDMPLFEIRELALRITGTGGISQRVSLVRDAKRWRFETPLPAPADSIRVESALTGLTSLKANRFFESTVEESGLTGSAIPIRITLEGSNRRQTLLVGNPVPNGSSSNPQLYARMDDNPTIFSVDAALFEPLRNPQETLRERQFLIFDPAKITSIDLGLDDFTMTLQKLETGQWQVIRKSQQGRIQPMPADTRQVDALLKGLRELTAVRFVNDAPSEADLERYGFREPQRVVRLKGGDTERTLLIGLGRNDDQSFNYYAKLEQSPSIYQVLPPVLELVQVDPLHYRSRVLEQLPSGARIVSLKLTDTATQTTLLDIQSATDSADPWSAALAALGSEEKQKAAAQLLANVRKFETAGYTANHDREWRYTLTAQIILPGGTDTQSESRVYRFTERLGGTRQIGWSEHKSVAFHCTQTLIDALFTLTFTEASKDDLLQPMPESEANTLIPPTDAQPAQPDPSTDNASAPATE